MMEMEREGDGMTQERKLSDLTRRAASLAVAFEGQETIAAYLMRVLELGQAGIQHVMSELARVGVVDREGRLLVLEEAQVRVLLGEPEPGAAGEAAVDEDAEPMFPGMADLRGAEAPVNRW